MTAKVIVKLERHHAVDQFDCGEPRLNQFLIRYALTNQAANGSQTFVCEAAGGIAGFVTLATGSVEFEVAPDRMRKGLARYPVPVIVLARLAVDVRFQGQGIGASLLKDALLRVLNTANDVGVRAVVVHAKTEEARRFYLRNGFSEGFADPMDLFLLTKEMRAQLA